MNLWSDDNASFMEAFMTSDLSSFWSSSSVAVADPLPSIPATFLPHHHQQPQLQPPPPLPPPPPPPPTAAAASSSSYDHPEVKALTQETIQQRLQSLIDSDSASSSSAASFAAVNWTYAIFWQSSYDYSLGPLLGWGDGYYKGEPKSGNSPRMTTRESGRGASSAAEQEHRRKVLRELNSLIAGPSDANALSRARCSGSRPWCVYRSGTGLGSSSWDRLRWFFRPPS